MLSNKIGKPSKVQILLLYTSGQNGEKKIIKQSENPKQRNCKILNCKAKETHLIP